jgi:hypothetical protein
MNAASNCLFEPNFISVFDPLRFSVSSVVKVLLF